MKRLASCIQMMKAQGGRMPAGLEAGIDRQVRREMRSRKDAVRSGRMTEEKSRYEAEKSALETYLDQVQGEIQSLVKSRPTQKEVIRERQAEETPNAREEGLLKEPPAESVPAVDVVANDAATSPKNDLPEPTDAQKEAGNYAKGHTRIAGLDISIENPAGSKRRPEWKALKDHYGYFKRSIAFDAPDNVDVFVKPGTPNDFAGRVYVVDQIDPKTGRFDEHKSMLGYASKAEASDAYHRNYESGWKGMASITAMPQEKFRDWLRSDAPSKGPVDKGAVMRTRAKAFDAQPKMSAPRKMDALKKPASRQTDTPAFKQWFKQSTVVNEDGTPKVMYHGTAQDITEFKPKQAGAIFVTDRSDFAEDFSGYSEGWMSENFTPSRAQEKAAVARAREILIAEGEKPENIAKYSATEIKDEYAYQQALQDLLPSRANIMPLYVSAQNPFDYENKAHVDALTKALSADAKLADKIGRGFWGVIESPPVQKAIKGLGHDGFNVFEGGHKNLAVYESSQLKSAIGNQGTFDAGDPDIRRSAQRQTDTPTFRKWFGKSVVTKDGKAGGEPVVFFHGTRSDINEFDPARVNERFPQSIGIHFASTGREASLYADSPDNMAVDWKPTSRFAKPLVSGANVVPVYLKVENPLIIDSGKMVPSDYADSNREEILRRLAESRRDRKVVDDDDLLAALKGDDAAKVGERIVKASPYDGVIIRRSKGDGWDGANVIVFSPTQAKSATGNTGSFDPANPDIRKSGQRARWDVDEPSKMDDFIRTMQDKHVDLKRVTQAIEEQVGKIEDKFNPYQAEELYHGRTAKQTTDFLKGDLKKLLTDMRLRKIGVEDIGKFLHARHAEERNKRMAAINPNDPDMQDGGSGMSTKDAKAYLSAMSPEQRKAYDAIAARVDAINKGTQDLLVSSGLEKQSTIDAWNGAYKNYVPLMRDEVAETVGAGTGQGFSVRGSASKRAMGSKKDVIDILANVAMQRERAIIRAEKNRVAQALWGLAAKAENKDIWLAVSPSDDPVKLQSDLVKMGMNPIDAAGVAKEPQQRYVDPKTGMVQWRVNPMLRSASNVVAMRVDGEERYVIMNERSDRAKAIATSIKNLDADQLGAVLSVSAKISRFFASINTQYNPMFGVVNAVRDVQAAALNLSATPLAGKQKEVISQTMSALKGIYADLRAQRAGGAASSKWAALFEEFQKEGGQTGYRDMFANSADRGKGLESELRKISEGKAKATGRAVFDWLTDYNDSMENAVRLATYKTAKDNGLSNQQAASVAKNLMNFNRKGSVATQAGALYAFFNASMQGTARIAETMFDMKGGDVKTIRLNKNGKKILYGGLLFGSAQALMLAAAGFDDDEIPEFIRERNLIIPTGGKKYVTIPMPLGLHVIPNFGRVTTEFALSGGKKPGERLVSMFAVLADAFNPIGNSGMSIQTIAPTAVDPLVALAENRDFTGRPISRPDFSSLNPQPGHTRAKDTASFIGKGMSYALNLVTGGTDYKPGAFSPTPDQIDYLLGQLTGGVGREAMKAQQTLSAGYTGEDLPPHKVPLLGRFYGDAGVPSAQSSKFYQHVTELNGHKSEIDGRIKAGKPVGDYMRENPEFALIPLATSTQRQISDLKKMKKMLADNGNNKAAKMIEDQITMAMRTLNDRYKAIEARQ